VDREPRWLVRRYQLAVLCDQPNHEHALEQTGGSPDLHAG